MQNDLNDKQLLSIGEASEYLGISIDTLRRWERKNRIEPFRSPGGHRYFKKDDLDKLFGKRYLRDEPTQRSKGYGRTPNPDTPFPIDNQSTHTSIPTPIQDSSFQNPTYPRHWIQPTPPPSLPSWRKAELASEELNSVESEYFQSDNDNRFPKTQENVQNEVVQTETFETRFREVPIPDRSPIRVVEDSSLSNPHEAYLNQQRVSILTPPSQPQSDAKAQSASQPVLSGISNISQKIQNSEEKVTIDKNTLMYISLGAGIFLLGMALYVIWRSSQNVLSPVP